MSVQGRPIFAMPEPEVPISRALEIVLARVSMDRKTADVLRKLLDRQRDEERIADEERIRRALDRLATYTSKGGA
jgi:hypothetical protein